MSSFLRFRIAIIVDDPLQNPSSDSYRMQSRFLYSRHCEVAFQPAKQSV